MRTTKVKIGGEEYNLRITIRAMFLFEQAQGKAFGITDTLDTIVYYYCLLKASNPDTFTKTLDGFIDLIDEAPETLQALSEAVLDLEQSDVHAKKKNASGGKKKA